MLTDLGRVFLMGTVVRNNRQVKTSLHVRNCLLKIPQAVDRDVFFKHSNE